jgi:hypothetical protein
MNIELEHPEYAARKVMWRTYRDLHAGGERLRANAREYLMRRQKEPADVYGERLSRVFYENYIGSIIDWYAATLFRREPILSFSGENEAARSFLCQITEDCDLKETSLCEFFRRQLVESLVSGMSYTLVDFPRFSQPAANRAEEDAQGASRAYLVPYGPEDLINWSYDVQGNFESVVLRTSGLRQDESAGWTTETRWSYYDKEQFQIYQQTKRTGTNAKPELIDEGRHGLAGLRRVPLFPLKVSNGLWLMNKAAMLQLEHFNKSNALGWALTMGLFAMPVVYSERPWKEIVGESYYIQLAPNDKFGWTEPEGKVYQVASDNLDRLKNEIYRVCYMIPQAWDVSQAQSGLSKLRDFTITQEVLRAYGDAVKDTMKRVLRAITAARQDEVKVDVSGLDEFDIGDFSSDLDDAGKLLTLETASPTLRREVLKKLTFKYLCDLRQEVKDRIAAEIEGANAVADERG